MTWCSIYLITSVILHIYSEYSTASEYYVSADHNRIPCPTHTPCHKLSYYVSNYTTFFTNNTIFYFQEGSHSLEGTLMINGVSNITLQGLGHIEQGFHETVIQSTSIIICHYNGNIIIDVSTNVVLKSLTITKCGYRKKYKAFNLVITETYVVTMKWVSVQNGSSLGLYLNNTFNLLITYSSFANNQHLRGCLYCYEGNAIINYFQKPINITHYKVDILYSNFTFGSNHHPTCFYNQGQGYGYNKSGGGLSILLMAPPTKMLFTIDSVVFYNNSAKIGSNFYFWVYKGNYTLTIKNTISIYGKAIFTRYDCCEGTGMALIHMGQLGSVSIENSYFLHNVAKAHGGGVSINWINNSGTIFFHNSTISNNSAPLGSGLYVSAPEWSRGTLQKIFFKDVSFDSNKIPYKRRKFASAVTIVNVYKFAFQRIMITNHDATGILSYHNVLIFLDNNTIANNSGIFGGGIALYDASEIVSQQRISFLNNHASISGGGIFVSQLIGVDIGTACFFNIFTQHAMFYFVNNTAEVSGDVLYGGNIDKCHVKFDHYFHYPTQTGLSVVSSDPIQVCFCESKRPNCSITKISMTGMPGTNVNMPPIATVGIKDGLTEGIIKFTDSSSNEHIYNLSANCNIITYEFKMNSSLNTTQVSITLESTKDNLYDGYDPPAKAIEIIVESCPVGFPLVNGTCVCRSELNTSSIKCDINKQIISRDGDMWIGYQNDSDCLIIYQNIIVHSLLIIAR